MKNTLPVYMMKSFLKSSLLIGGGLCGLLLIFDLLANMNDVIAPNDSVMKPLFYYMALRLSDIIVLVLPLAALMAALVTIIQKVSSHEIVIMRAAGIPSYHITAMLMGGAVVLCILQFLMMNYVQSYTAKQLQDWQNRDYRLSALSGDDDKEINWVASGDHLVYIGSSSVDGQLLNDLKIVERDDSGQLVSYLEAVQAVYRDGQWTLFDVYQPAMGDAQDTQIQELSLDLGIEPSLFSRLADRPVEWSVGDLVNVLHKDELQDKPAYVYSLWLQRKFAAPIGVLVMVLLAMPLAIQIARQSSFTMHISYTIVAGFAFFILERLFETMGEAGTIPSVVAAWTPAMLFAMLSSWLLLMREG